MHDCDYQVAKHPRGHTELEGTRCSTKRQAKHHQRQLELRDLGHRFDGRVPTEMHSSIRRLDVVLLCEYSFVWVLLSGRYRAIDQP